MKYKNLEISALSNQSAGKDYQQVQEFLAAIPNFGRRFMRVPMKLYTSARTGWIFAAMLDLMITVRLPMRRCPLL